MLQNVNSCSCSGASYPENGDGSSALTSFSSVLTEDAMGFLSESPFLQDASFYRPFIVGNDSRVTWGGARDIDGEPIGHGDGYVLIEVNDAESNNNWFKVGEMRVSPVPEVIVTEIDLSRTF